MIHTERHLGDAVGNPLLLRLSSVGIRENDSNFRVLSRLALGGSHGEATKSCEKDGGAHDDYW